MQSKIFRLVILLATFFIGISAVCVWFLNRQTILEVSAITISNDIEPKFEILNNDSQITEEDYAVYSVILVSEQYNSELIVVSDSTSHGLIADPTNISNKNYQLSEDIINDYRSKNENDLKLKDNFSVQNKVLFLSEKEESQFFRKVQENGWVKFHKKYPKAKGIVSFSRIGFNQENTQALVSVSFGCGFLCGEGNFILLQKENGKWTIQNKIGLWVS